MACLAISQITIGEADKPKAEHDKKNFF